MMYYGETPWHGLGTCLERPATAGDALNAAKLNWAVTKKPLWAIEGEVKTQVKTKFAIVREDRWGQEDCPVFGIVGQQYTPLQNADAFKFFDPIVGENAAVYHTAGALGDGERVWILAKLPDTIQVIGDDITEKYLLLSNSHDGNSSVQVKFTPIRVVCQNTLSMALRDGDAIRIPHLKDVRKRLDEAHKLLGIINRRYSHIADRFRAFTRVQVDSDRLNDYLKALYPDPRPDSPEHVRKSIERHRLASEHLFDQGRGNRIKGVAGTLWAAYNGAVEYVDYRQSKQSAENRLESVWFGNGYLLKVKAFTVAVDMLRAWQN